MPGAHKPRNHNLTVPNAISVLRIVLIPFFAAAFLRGNLPLAAGILVLSGLSDVFDGMIARKFNQVTELGKMLDPLADKLTQGTVAICLAVRFPNVRILLLFFVVKELCMVLGAVILLRRKKRPSAANWYGKAATVMFYLSVGAIVVMDGFLKLSGPVFRGVSLGLLLATGGMMLFAAVQYFRIFWETLHSDDEKYDFDLADEIRKKD